MLNEKQKAFCREYTLDFNGTQSAIRAGYSKKTAKQIGSKLLTLIDVQQEISRLNGEKRKDNQLTAEYVLGSLREITERCMQRQPVMVKEGRYWVQKTEENDQGEEVGVWDFDSSGAIKSLELLGKHLALFTDKIKHSGDEETPMVIKFVE